MATCPSVTAGIVSKRIKISSGVELLRAVTFCTEIEYVKRNSLVSLGHKVAFCSVSNGDEITLYMIAFHLACA